MTCIAVRDRIMACDSCWNLDGLIDVLAKKIERLPSGAIVGQAGDNDAREIVKLLSGVKTKKSLPSRSDLMNTRVDFMGILLLPSGEIFKVSSSHLLPEQTAEDIGVWEITGFPYAAVGSGSLVAMGALARGASAKQAVEAAIKHDTNCRGPVHSLGILKDKK